jgi:hypothetical protein
MSIYVKINDDIKTAMKERQSERLSVLRMMKSKIMTVDTRGDLSDTEIIKIISSYEKSLKDALTQYESADRPDEVLALRSELAVISEYLPKKLSEIETIDLIKTIITETGASSKADMGKVMKGVMASGQPIDGGLVKQLVDKLLI